MPFLPSLPDDAVLTNLFLDYPEICKPLVEMSDAIMTGPSPFRLSSASPKANLLPTWPAKLERPPTRWVRFCRAA